MTDNPQADYENEKYHHEMDELERTIAEQQATIDQLRKLIMQLARECGYSAAGADAIAHEALEATGD